MQANHTTQRTVEVTADDLPFFCPTADTSLWNGHPRVFIPVDETGEARCPYCGTLYKFTGTAPRGHH